MKDTMAKIRELKSAAEDHLDSSFDHAFVALFEAGLATFIVKASERELSRFAVEAGSGSLKDFPEKVCKTPCVTDAIIKAVGSIEAELHSTFAVAEEAG